MSHNALVGLLARRFPTGFPELLADPGFDTPSQWTAGAATWVVSGGKATYTSPGGGVDFLRSNDTVTLTGGVNYRVILTFSGIGSGLMAVFGLFNRASSVNLLGSYQNVSANGAATFDFTPASTQTGINIYANGLGSAPSWSLESISIKQR